VNTYCAKLPKQAPKHYWSLENNTIDLAPTSSRAEVVFVADAANYQGLDRQSQSRHYRRPADNGPAWLDNSTSLMGIASDSKGNSYTGGEVETGECIQVCSRQSSRQALTAYLIAEKIPVRRRRSQPAETVCPTRVKSEDATGSIAVNLGILQLMNPETREVKRGKVDPVNAK
jgi:hypothetical protein